MKNIYLLFIIMVCTITFGCTVYESPKRGTHEEREITYYSDLFDPIEDKGQYWHPQYNVVPNELISVHNIAKEGHRNHLGETNIDRGLQAHLLAQSVAGLINRAVKNGTSNHGIWLEVDAESYSVSKQALKDLGCNTGWAACVPNQLITAFAAELRKHFSGYVLTDVVNNPESAVVASVASHVYNAFIVDVRDEAVYSAVTDANGTPFQMLYDARNKTTADSWREFKDKCKRNALVVMPVQTAELREFSITNELFVVNMNHSYGNPMLGQNLEIMEEILAWLEPNSPIYGWEQGVAEDAFVGRVTQYGHRMIPYDWAWNTNLCSAQYPERQKSLVTKSINPQLIDYEDDADKYVSYYLSDGDNVQWMMNDFDVPNYFAHPQASETKMTFGFPFANLPMMAPAWFDVLLPRQPDGCTMIENLGGGYFYVDLFGINSNRVTLLDKISSQMAAHMRQHGTKILGLVAMDVASTWAKDAYQKFISANDQLEGIVVIQYAPYAGGAGEIMWFPNSDGIDIPVVTVRYSIWNFETQNTEREGSPTYIAHRINDEPESSKFSAISIHAWSRFTDIGDSSDELAELDPSGGVVGAGAAALCQAKLGDNVRVVNMQELIWRIRMHYRPEQTELYLSKVF